MSTVKNGVGSSVWEAAIQNQTINLVIGTERPAILQRQVVAVRIQVNACISTAGKSIEGKSPAHFRLFLVLRGVAKKSADSVELNSTTDPHRVNKEPVDPLRPQLVVKTYEDREFSISKHGSSSDSLKENTGRIAQQKSANVSVEQVLALLLEKGRDRYELDPDTGSGCRYWCQTVLGDMVEERWLAKGADQQVNVVSEKLARECRWAHVHLPEQPPRGRFYDPPSD